MARSNQLRTMLIEMNPITDPAYDTLFQALVSWMGHPQVARVHP